LPFQQVAAHDQPEYLPMKSIRIFIGSLGVLLSFTAAADALTTLNDADLFKKAQDEVAQMSHADLDALIQPVATCDAVSLGQRPQQFECERAIYAWWARANRGRAIDTYMSAIAGLLTGFDNNSLNPSTGMLDAYKKTSVGLVALTNAINQRYRQLDK
jgi:hypothetical protein